MSEQVFNLPDVGEGLTEAEIVAWHVIPGQTVAINDSLVDIETAKSVVELPSPYAGEVELLVDAGQLVDVGSPIVRFHTTDPARPVSLQEPERHPAASEDEAPQVLVGPGPKAPGVRRRRLTPAAPTAAPTPAPTAAPAGAVPPPAPPLALPTVGTPAGRPMATPPVRYLARRLGVDLRSLTVVGPITRDDVHRAAASLAPAVPPAVATSEAPQNLDRETRIPVKGVRRATAAAMVRSAFTAPHVTEWLTVDMTETMQLVRQLKADRGWQGVRVNPLLFVAKAYLTAIRSYPDINASWDEESGHIVVKHYVNLGIAAATPRGLLVPNIKDADRMKLRALSTALDDLVATARSGRTPPGDMAGGTVTITNIGALGVDAGTPILNPGESAILAFGAVRAQPWVVDGQICVREVTQLAMSFDHRLVDGELGSQVLARTGELLTAPQRFLLYV